MTHGNGNIVHGIRRDDEHRGNAARPRTGFGSRAAKPRAYLETSWAGEQWTRGCPLGITGPGTLIAYGPHIRKPVGRIHWAGAETATYWNGYMDGAVRSGERAASEVLAKL